MIEQYESSCVRNTHIENVGNHRVYRFDNDLGGSVILFDDNQTCELAVIRFHSSDDQDWLTFPENGIVSEGFINNLNKREVADLLEQIRCL